MPVAGVGVASKGRLTAAVGALAVLGIAFPTLFVLAFTIACLAIVFAIGHFAGILLKIVWILVFPLFAALRALWSPVRLSEGEPLIPAQAPELFALIDRLRAEARAAPIHAVFLTAENNASMAQLPRYGMFGGTRNELRLGLPLMLAMDEAHFTAVLAHEIGHLARRHGGFTARVYAMRATLDLMVENLAQQRSFLVYPVLAFYRAFVPRFDRATLQLARALEHEADASAATAVGARVTVESLTLLNGVGWFFAGSVWPAIFATSTRDPEPPHDVYAVIGAHFHAPIPNADQLVAAAFAAPGSDDDTHPALADRVRALGYEPAALGDALTGYAVAGRSAADVFLTGARGQRARLAQAWRSAVLGRWRERFAEAELVRTRLAGLDALGTAASPDQRKERALAAAELQRADALDLLLSAADQSPNDADLSLQAGTLLAERDDTRSLHYLERAIENDVRATVPAATAARSFLSKRGDTEAVRRWNARVREFQGSLAAANAERAEFTGGEPIEPHGLDDDTLAIVRKALDLPGIDAAYLARRRLAYLDGVPHFVLAVARTRTRDGTSDENFATIIRDDLEAFPYGVNVVISSKRGNRVLEALATLDGTRVPL